jgi:hypothetical protein
MDKFYGVISEQVSANDYVVGTDYTPPKALVFTGIAYNQDEIDGMSCTLHGAMTALSTQTGYTFTLEDRKEILAMAKERGFSSEWGWYVNLGVKCVADWWNNKKTDKVKYYRVLLDSEQSTKAQDLGYRLVTAYRGNRNYNNDAFFEGDCELDMVKNVGATTYGHCITINNGIVIDNYNGVRACNIYKVLDIIQAVRNGIFFNEAYFFVPDSFNNNVISEWAIDAVQFCKDKGIATQWGNPKEIVKPEIIELMLYRAGIIKSYTGKGLSKERLAVIIRNFSL